jgi:hypothetical protein
MDIFASLYKGTRGSIGDVIELLKYSGLRSKRIGAKSYCLLRPLAKKKRRQIEHRGIAVRYSREKMIWPHPGLRKCEEVVQDPENI